MNAKKPITLLITILFISPIISAQSFEDFFEGVLDAFAERALFTRNMPIQRLIIQAL